MFTQRYSVSHQPIQTLLTWVQSSEIAIPEIQRPFVWEATKVRNLLDSLYQGYPVGYLISWRNPTVKLKDGSTSAGKRILIDGQQRVTALMASLLGIEVLTEDYETVQIRIAFNPQDESFEVTNSAIRKNPVWIPDVGVFFNPETKIFQLVSEYCMANPNCVQDQIHDVIEKIRGITHNNVGIIELAGDLDIVTVTEIFIRVNSAGAQLSQADFVMSKIAVNESYGGNLLRKAIDYFCHLSVAPEFLGKIKKGDEKFVASEFYDKIRWIADVNCLGSDEMALSLVEFIDKTLTRKESVHGERKGGRDREKETMDSGREGQNRTSVSERSCWIGRSGRRNRNVSRIDPSVGQAGSGRT